MKAYVDTSALAKLYLPEAGSDDFQQWLVNTDRPVIARLAITEMFSALARLQRARVFDSGHVTAVRRRIERDLGEGLFAVVPAGDETHQRACHLLVEHYRLPLRTLDALHLAACVTAGAELLATSDRRQAAAAALLGLEVKLFPPDG